jgi:hypothetical protein
MIATRVSHESREFSGLGLAALRALFWSAQATKAR